MTLGLYIHIPFCKRKCLYCDFISFEYEDKKADAYINAIIKESLKYNKEKIETIYIGGGTPSVLSLKQLETLIKGIKENFDITDLQEFTVELNPESTTIENLKLLFDLGISRLSFGLQSANDNELVNLGRLHNFDTFLSGYNNAKSTGFDNISVDLIYGIENQTIESWQQTLANVLNLNSDHISLYPLTIEKNTPFYSQNKKIDYDLQGSMYKITCDELKKNDFIHYEISNWAKNNKSSKHNTLYWKNKEYIGLGVSASSYYKRERFKNVLNTDLYIKNVSLGKNYVLETEHIDDNLYKTETLMLGLRLAEGIELSLLNDKKDVFQKYLEQNLLTVKDERVALTERGFWVSNSIISDFM